MDELGHLQLSLCFLKFILMKSTIGTTLSKLIQSPTAINRQKVGLISRRPSQNQSFSRKKPQDVFFTDAKVPSKQNSREKIRSQVGGLQHQRSVQIFKAHVCQKMKFLSPDHQTQSKVLNSFHGLAYEKSPRFSRKNQIQIKKEATNSFCAKKEARKLEDTFGTCISQISLQSCAAKDEVPQTQPQTIDELFESSRENLELRQHNLNLKHEIQIYKAKCDYLQQKVTKYETQTRKSASFTSQCNFCTLLQEEIIKNGRHTGLLEVKLAQRDKQVEKLKKELKYQISQYQKLSLQYNQLYKQLQDLNSKHLQQQRVKLELSHIITSLNSKLGDTAEQIRYLGIQHNILLKKKQEYEQSKTQSAKLLSEKQALKKLVAQYKQKLDVIRKINSKKKVTKQKKKEIYHEDIFQLSSEHSADGR